MVSKNLDRSILAIAWPAIVSNITTPLLGLVDTTIAGHIGSADALAAIALGSTVFNLIYWLFGFLRMSTAGLTAQAFGANDGASQSAVLERAALMSALIASVIIAFSPLIGPFAISLLDANDSIGPLVISYFNILIWGAPAVLANYAINGWLIGMQDTRLPMLIALVANILNIALSSVLVFCFGLGIEGIACGTLISQWVAFAAGSLFIIRKYSPTFSRPTFDGFGRLLKMNIDIFLRTLCMVCVTAWFTRAGSAQSVNILAANAILMQFFLLFSYFSDGFAYAGEALAGKFCGAKDFAGLRSLVSRLLKWGAIVALIFSTIYFIGGQLLLDILTDRREVIDTAREFLPWAVSVPLCGMAAFIYDGVYVGLTRTRRMFLSVLYGMAVYFAVYFMLRDSLGNHALWLAFVMYLVVRGIVLHFAFAASAKSD